MGIEILINQMGDRLKFRKRKNGGEFKPSWFGVLVARVDENNKQFPYTFVKSFVSTNY
jgi:hypothetical protein